MTESQGRVATPGRSDDPSVQDAVVVARALGVDPETGLTSQEAAARLERDGPNELRAEPPEPTWGKVLRQFQDPLVYLLLVAMVISVVAWVVEGARGLPIDVIVIGAIVLANAAIGLVQERTAESAVAALSSMTAAASTVLRDGRLTTVPSAGLVRADVLVLSEGDAVGADARILSATALRVQEASLTGESEATDKTPATLPGPTGHRRPARHGLQGQRRGLRRGPGGGHRDRHVHGDGHHRHPPGRDRAGALPAPGGDRPDLQDPGPARRRDRGRLGP